MTLTLGHFLSLGAILFALSVIGIFLNRRNLIVLLMAIELMLLAVNMNFIAFSQSLGDLVGQVFALFVLTVAAGEVVSRAELLDHVERTMASGELDDVGLVVDRLERRVTRRPFHQPGDAPIDHGAAQPVRDGVENPPHIERGFQGLADRPLERKGPGPNLDLGRRGQAQRLEELLHRAKTGRRRTLHGIRPTIVLVPRRDRAAFDAHQARTRDSAWFAAMRSILRDFRVEELRD